MKAHRSLVRAALLLAIAVAPAAGAETVYVIEQLVVGVTTAPDSESERITTIRSGESAEVLETQGDYSRVQLPSGTEGWVKSSYLSSELPLQNRLTARTQEAEQLRKDLRKLEAELKEARLAAAAPPPAPEPTPVEAAPEPVDSAPVQEPSLLMPNRASTGPGWLWVIGSSALALLVGFALGWHMLDRRIRAKYGGLRIY